MPAKKAASGTSDEAGEGKFVWEGGNENKLLLIILGRHIQTSEFEEVAKAFPGATGGAIRNRIGVLRAKQKKVYEELGWELPNGTAMSAKKTVKSTPSKRASEEDGEQETPTKKPRAPRKKKETKSETPEKDSGAEDNDEKLDAVKSEPEEV